MLYLYRVPLEKNKLIIDYELVKSHRILFETRLFSGGAREEDIRVQVVGRDGITAKSLARK